MQLGKPILLAICFVSTPPPDELEAEKLQPSKLNDLEHHEKQYERLNTDARIGHGRRLATPTGAN